MDTIYNLQKRADELRKKTETDSITPEEVGGLHADTLAYVADMEQNMDGLGIRCIYKTYAAMIAEGETPVGTNGKALRYGQLVVVYDATNTAQAESGNIYAWQKGTGAAAWLQVGNINAIIDYEAKIASEAAARSEADAALQTLAEGVVGRIDVTAIDTVPGSVEDALTMAKDTLHSRWTLTYRSVLNVGVLDIFSDNAGHQLTEVLTTHYTMNSDGVLDFASHDDGAVTRYWRSYNISSPHLKNDKGTWSDWAEDIPASLQTRLDEIEGDVVAAQSAADKAQASADKAQSDVAALAATKGEAGGIAALDDDLKVPSANMPDSAFEVLEFAGMVSGVTALDQSVAQPAGVAFDTAAKSFYAYTVSGGGVVGTRTYYKSWGNWLRYKADADGVPYTGKIYIDTTTNTPYRWNGTTMTALTPKQVTLTQEEYDALVDAGAVDADTYYNVIEEA